MISELFKILQIILVLSPFFLTVLTLGWLITRGAHKLEKHATYWLVGLILLLVILTYGIFTNNISSFSAVLGVYATESYWQTYIRLKGKKKSASKKI